jgi:hypothetical protein
VQICYDDTNGFFLWVRLDVDKKRVELPEEAERLGLDIETFMANRMLEILRENEILYEDGKRDDKGHLGGMLGAG